MAIPPCPRARRHDGLHEGGGHRHQPPGARTTTVRDVAANAVRSYADHVFYGKRLVGCEVTLAGLRRECGLPDERLLYGRGRAPRALFCRSYEPHTSSQCLPVETVE